MTTPVSLLTEDIERAPDDPGLGMLTCDRGWLPLSDVDVEAAVSGLNASVTIRQIYTNPFSHSIEATYIHPLPDRGALTAFAVTIGERRIIGVLEERSQARADYDEAIAAGHRAAITEEDRPDVFTTRVGNLHPGDRAEVEITLVQPLPWADGQTTFRFPLVVAPRYIPGGPIDGESVGEGVAVDTDAVPDASRIRPPVLLPGIPNPVRLGLRVRFEGAVPEGLESSLHTVAVDGTGVQLQPGERLDRDFILRWPTSTGQREMPRASMTVQPDVEGEDGTFTFVLEPPLVATSGPPRDVIVVLDRSGSMGGWKMVAARRAAARIIDSLASTDRFAIVAFDDRIERPPQLPDALVTATDRHRWLAVEWLASLEARGGTELRGPLAEAMATLSPQSHERDSSCLVVTDGQVGNEDQLLAELSSDVDAVRIFTVGIDQAVNAGFLRRLAALGGGRCELVESEDRLDEVMRALHRRIASAALASVEISADTGAIHALSPGGPVDCFAGVPLVIRGRYTGPVPELRWRSGNGTDGNNNEVNGVRVKRGQSGDPAARPLWARARIRDLEDQFVALHFGEATERDRLGDEIVQLSLSTGVLSRFTAFLAVDRGERVDGSAPMPVVQPVEMPAGWRATSATQAWAAPPSAAPQSAAPTAYAAEVGAATPQAASRRRRRARSRAPGERQRTESSMANATATAPPLRRYLDRLDELVDRIANGDDGTDIRRRLDDLVGDLRSVGAPRSLITIVEELLDALRSGQSIRQTIDRAKEALADNGGDGEVAPRRRRARFWR